MIDGYEILLGWMYDAWENRSLPGDEPEEPDWPYDLADEEPPVDLADDDED
jgi:hypothetical protein